MTSMINQCVFHFHMKSAARRISARMRLGAERTLEEQLTEMTALILRLPEVESLLQRAGMNTNTNAAMQEPKAALTLFIKVHAYIQRYIFLPTC